MKFKDKHPFIAYVLVQFPMCIAAGLCIYPFALVLVDEKPLNLNALFVNVTLALLCIIIGNFFDKKFGVSKGADDNDYK